jgi:hypothetical protein
MPSGWSDWKFWQDSSTGSVAGIGGNVDTNFFNGTLVQLKAMTVKVQQAPTGSGEKASFDVPHAYDGSQGAVIGITRPADETLPPDPCAPR